MFSRVLPIIGVLCALAAARAEAASNIPKPDPAMAAGCWAGAIKEHPRLLGPRSYLQALAKAGPAGYRICKSIHSKNKSFMVTADGIVEAVEGAPKDNVAQHVKAALILVAAGPTNEHQSTWLALDQVARTYDFFYESITPADRAKMIAFLNAHLGRFNVDEDAFHNSTLSKISTYLRVAYGTWGDNPRAKDFRDYALVKLYEGKVAPVLAAFGQGGGFTECGWYARGSVLDLVEGLELARRFEKYDGFQKAPAFFYGRMAFEVFSAWPSPSSEGSERFPCEGDGSSVYGSSWEAPRYTRSILAQYWRGSELAALVAARARGGANPESRVLDWLEVGKPDAPTDLKTAPLSHLARGIGHVYARSDWSAAATGFRFSCGPYWTLHQHYDVGNFEIFQSEPLATESGEYSGDDGWSGPHAVNWLIRTVAHNCVLVNDPSERFNSARDKDNVMISDGGQGGGRAYAVADTLSGWPRKSNERGVIVAYQDTPEALYVAGDCTRAYSPNKMAGWLRQVVFIRPGTFVMLDRVAATRAEFEKAWLLHCRNEPVIDGATATIANGRGQLVVQTLLPEKAKIVSVKGYTYGGKTFNIAANSQTPAANLWRLQVGAPSPAKMDLFLHVMTTVKGPPAELTRKGTSPAVKIGDVEVLFDSKLGVTVKSGGNTTVFEGEVVPGKWQ